MINSTSIQFGPQTQLCEIVAQSKKGALFFHNHQHVGSYQLIIRSLPDLVKGNVKHFYLELPGSFNQALQKYQQGQPQALSQIVNSMSCSIVKENMENLIKKVTEVGIQIFAVDVQITSTHGLIGNEKKSKEFVNSRLKCDQKIYQNIVNCAKSLKNGGKFIGLFGGNHVAIGEKLKVPLLCFHACETIEGGHSFCNLRPSDFGTQTEEERKHVNLFDLFILALPNLEDAIDYTKEHHGYGIQWLNKLLTKLNFSIQCKAYSHTKSCQVDAVATIPHEGSEIVWNQVCSLLDGLGKRMDFQDGKAIITFENIESEDIKRRILEVLVKKTSGK